MMTNDIYQWFFLGIRMNNIHENVFRNLKSNMAEIIYICYVRFEFILDPQQKIGPYVTENS